MPESGWYDDPDDATQLRYWDGTRWTEQRRSRETPPPPPPAPTSPAPQFPPSPWDTAASGDAGSWGASSGSTGSTGSAGSTGSTGGDASWGAGASVLAGAAPPRTFVEAVKVCLTKYVDGKGRASRSEYWYFALFSFLVDVVTGGVAAILLLLPSLTVSIRRLHDIGKSGWALLWILFPVIGWIVLIVYAVRPGEPHANAYG